MLTGTGKLKGTLFSLSGTMYSLIFFSIVSLSLSCQLYSPGLLHVVGSMALYSYGSHSAREQREFPKF